MSHRSYHVSLIKRVHDYFLPNRRNEYQPHIFRRASLAVIFAGLLVFEAGYLVQIKFIFSHTNFLAAVLPGTLVALTNVDRSHSELPNVTENKLLDQAATLAAKDMANNGYFAHVSPTGITPWDWLNRVGYVYSYAGENLAVNFTDSTAVENAWMASPAHHANIVKPQYTQMGVGVANGIYQGKQSTFVVTFFATPAAGTVPASQGAEKTLVPTKSDSAASVPLTESVLGAQTPSAVSGSPAHKTASLFDTIATSPTRLVLLVLWGLAGLVLVLALVSSVVGLRRQYVEVVGGGFVLLFMLLAFIAFDTQTASEVHLPSGTQPAAVFLAQ